MRLREGVSDRRDPSEGRRSREGGRRGQAQPAQIATHRDHEAERRPSRWRAATLAGYERQQQQICRWQPRPWPMRCSSIFLLALGHAGALTVQQKYVGWIGPYHPSSGTTHAAPGVKNGTAVWEAFQFGTVCMENAVSDGGYALEEDIALHCDTWDVNSVYGMLLPPSEGGTFSSPNDTELYRPLSPAGLVQGAARWSRLAARCPQIAGVQIDDFLQNYVGTHPYTPPSPANYTHCAKCTAASPYPYGDGAVGTFCCSEKSDGAHCNKGECCISPGISEGCQGVKRCTDASGKVANPENRSVCGIKPPHAMLTLQNMKDIKAALLGHAVDPLTGAVDYSSPAKTPHLKLFICWYTMETAKYGWVKDDGLLQVIDGVNLWIWDQTTPTPGYTAEVAKVRAVIGPDTEMMAAAYLLNSGPCKDWCNIDGFDSILKESIELYDEGQLVGMYLFAGGMLAAGFCDGSACMNQTEWDKWALPAKLQAEYYPYLGEGEVVVSDASTGKPIAGAAVHVTYGGGAFVSRKLTSSSGLMKFGGWAGKSKLTPHSFVVSADGYTSANGTLQIKPQAAAQAKVALSRAAVRGATAAVVGNR